MRDKKRTHEGSSENVKRKNGALSWVMTILVTTLILLFIVGGAFWMRLHLSQGVMQLNSQKQELTQQIEEKKHAIVEMRNRKETLCNWDHIKAKINEFQLGMVKLDSNNVRYLSRCSIEEYNSGARLSTLMNAGVGSQATGVAMQSPTSSTIRNR